MRLRNTNKNYKKRAQKIDILLKETVSRSYKQSVHQYKTNPSDCKTEQIQLKSFGLEKKSTNTIEFFSNCKKGEHLNNSR